MPNFDDLKFVRIRDPAIFPLVVPRYLIEQIKGREWSVDRLYMLLPKFLRSPLFAVWVLVDATNVTKGVLCIDIDPFAELINVSAFSVDREYQDVNGCLRKKDSSICSKVLDFLHGYQDEFNKYKEKTGIELKRKIIWQTTRPRVYERMGGKRTKLIIMEV